MIQRRATIGYRIPPKRNRTWFRTADFWKARKGLGHVQTTPKRPTHSRRRLSKRSIACHSYLPPKQLTKTPPTLQYSVSLPLSQYWTSRKSRNQNGFVAIRKRAIVSVDRERDLERARFRRHSFPSRTTTPLVNGGSENRRVFF
jgi:hypothetical protein